MRLLIRTGVVLEMKIIFDSGIRTGSDVFKALALGAHAVQVGRLYVWGMAHEGEAGCRHVMKSLLAVSYVLSLAVIYGSFTDEQELDILMTVAGYQSIKKDVNRKALKYNPYGSPPAAHEHAKL